MTSYKVVAPYPIINYRSLNMFCYSTFVWILVIKWMKEEMSLMLISSDKSFYKMKCLQSSGNFTAHFFCSKESHLQCLQGSIWQPRTKINVFSRTFQDYFGYFQGHLYSICSVWEKYLCSWTKSRSDLSACKNSSYHVKWISRRDFSWGGRWG